MLNGKNMKVGTKVPDLAWEVDDLNASDNARTIECQQYRITKRAKGYHKRVITSSEQRDLLNLIPAKTIEVQISNCTLLEASHHCVAVKG